MRSPRPSAGGTDLLPPGRGADRLFPVPVVQDRLDRVHGLVEIVCEPITEPVDDRAPGIRWLATPRRPLRPVLSQTTPIPDRLLAANVSVCEGLFPCRIHEQLHGSRRSCNPWASRRESCLF